MALEVRVESAGAEWDAFVTAHPAATAYHAWAWRDVFGPVFGHEPIYLAARDAGQIVGVLPVVSFKSRLFGKFFCSLPFVNYGGVLSTSPDAAAALLAEATRLAREAGASHLELRHVDRQFESAPVRQHKVTMLLALKDTADAQWTALDNKVRNLVRKAEKSELTSESGGVELLDAFYAVFSVNMRDLGTPVYPKRFFAAVLKACGERARLHVVRHGSEPVGASMTIAHADRVEVPWASSLRTARQMNPNMLLYWHMLKDVIASGGRTFDFGRSTPGEGTYLFKKQWKAEPVPLHWEYALITREAPPDQSPGSGKFQMAIEMWKKLPVPIANTIGPLIIGNIP
ncbi:MAG TPA: FemAB family XrtA/PEP-CTERM system-associated protein [Luteitalea sp.]|nr:FemAB family XrtA/PEP-CTERM system-associated protein [Luteitalea sp.]